jgi:poly-gamma-glutamate capsule biosynthesis protein CapA/YwtB (metallophosphatase superfamily)
MLVWQEAQKAPVSRIAIAGDFLPASGLKLPYGRNWKDIAAGLGSCFANTDVGILNLECCVDVGNAKPRRKLGSGDSFSAPPSVLDFPLTLGTRIVGLANNHIYDYGEEGVARTRSAILDRGMIPLGIGKTLSDFPNVAIAQTFTGAKIGVWAAARHLPELATRKRRGIEPATRKRGQEALFTLKSEGASMTLAYLHAGLEHTNRPDPDDVALMDDLARMGFDIVTACHSHRIAGHNQIRREDGSSAFCFYGLGSLSSGVIYSALEREGLVVRTGLDESGRMVHLEVKPVRLEESGWGRVPLLADACGTLNHFEALSAEISNGNYKEKFYSDIKNGMFRRQLRDMRVAIRNGGVRGLVTKLGRVRMRHLQRVLRKGAG